MLFKTLDCLDDPCWQDEKRVVVSSDEEKTPWMHMTGQPAHVTRTDPQIPISCHTGQHSKPRVVAKQVAGALEGGDSLESLDISGNAVGSTGILALAKALSGNQNLRTLEVSYNPIEATGAKALIDMLKFDLKVCSPSPPLPSWGSEKEYRSL